MHSYFIPCHRKTEAKTVNFGGNKIAAHHGKVGYNTVEYLTVFMHSDWLYFLWHGIKDNTIRHFPGRSYSEQGISGIESFLIACCRNQDQSNHSGKSQQLQTRQ